MVSNDLQNRVSQRVSGGKLLQVPEEFCSFLELIEAHADSSKGPTVLEIGTRFGSNLVCLAELFKELGTKTSPRLVAVDLNIVPASSACKNLPAQCTFIQGDSQKEETANKVRSVLRTFNVEGFDLVFIDGDHWYAGVTRDFELYAPLVAPGGLLAFHDIRPSPSYPYNAGDVYLFWAELVQKCQDPTFGFDVKAAFVHDPNQEGAGIGVLERRKKT